MFLKFIHQEVDGCVQVYECTHYTIDPEAPSHAEGVERCFFIYLKGVEKPVKRLVELGNPEEVYCMSSEGKTVERVYRS